MNQFKYLRQSVTLSGLGSPTFQNALMAVNEIYGHFDRQFSEDVLEPWSCSPIDNDNFPCISLSNRYLTPASEAHGLEAVPFHKGVDPKGILQSMAKGDGLMTHVHTEDNQVQYFAMKKDIEGNTKSVKHFSRKFTTNFVLTTQIHRLQAANVPYRRHHTGASLLCCNPYKGWETKDVERLSFSSFGRWEAECGMRYLNEN